MMGSVTLFNDQVADIPNIVSMAAQSSAALVGDAVEKSLQKLSEMTTRAGQATADQLSGEVAKIAASLAASAENLKAASADSSTNIRQAGSALNESIRNSIKAVQEASLKSSQDLSDTITSLSTVVEGLCSRLSQSTAVLELQHGRLANAGEVVSSASTNFSGAAANVERSVAPLPAALAAIRAAMEQVVAASNQLRETSLAEQQAASMLNGTVGSAKAAFDEQAEKFGDLHDNVRGTMADLVNGVTRLAGEISTCIETYDSAIAKSIGGLENAILDVADVVELRPRDDRRAANG